MSPCYRVFGTSDALLEPITVVQQLSALGVQARGKFHDYGPYWYEAELILDDTFTLLLERYLREDELRPALQSWAAWLESVEDSRYHAWLTQHVLRTCQLFVLHQSAERAGGPMADLHIEELCAGLCRFLARQTDGVYQIDGQGFFDADGMLLVGEDEGEPPEDEDDSWAEGR